MSEFKATHMCGTTPCSIKVADPDVDGWIVITTATGYSVVRPASVTPIPPSPADELADAVDAYESNRLGKHWENVLDALAAYRKSKT